MNNILNIQILCFLRLTHGNNQFVKKEAT